MPETLTHRPFETIKAERKITRLHPGVVKRGKLQLSLVDQPRQAPLPVVDAPPEVQQPPVPQSKVSRREFADPETRTIAVARIRSLIDAGNGRKASIATVAKELAFSPSTVNKWLIRAGKMAAKKKKRSPEAIAKMKATIAAKKAAGLTGKKKRKYVRRAVANNESQDGTSIGDLLRTIKAATAEIERRLSQLSL